MKNITLSNFNRFLKINKKILISCFSRVLKSEKFILSSEVKKFEKNFSFFLKMKYCATLANGTDALEIALKACGIKRNQLVATTANSGMYATNAMLSIGAIPFFMDVSIDTHHVTLKEVIKAISSGVKAIVVTHLYGLAIKDIKKISKLCKKNKIALIEDCAQAHGAMISKKFVGSFGDVATFSFYPTKNLGCLGDGGAAVTNNKKIFKKIIKLRQYGWNKKYEVSLDGGRNSRLDEIQASILSNLLLSLNSLNIKRRKIANFYSKMIRNRNIIHPEIEGKNFVAHQYVLRTNKRNSLIKFLSRSGIAAEIHYPIPDHKQIIFKKRNIKTKLTNTEKLSKEVVSVPCNPYLKINEIKKIVNVLNSWRA